jgi:hypothetical protein
VFVWGGYSSEITENIIQISIHFHEKLVSKFVIILEIRYYKHLYSFNLFCYAIFFHVWS